MHDCQRFREDWIGGSVGESPDCEDCRKFCEEADGVLAALDTPVDDAQLPEAYWASFNNRLRRKLVDETTAAASSRYWMRWVPVLASAAAVVIVVSWVGFLRNPVNTKSPEPAARLEDNHIEGLDPSVVRYLGQAELDLRNFSKIEPSYKDEIEDARERASRSLAAIAERKEAADDFAPVRITLDEYENVLREIKNLDSPEDLRDVQSRIRRNGLIAKIKAYQPRVVLASNR